MAHTPRNVGVEGDEDDAEDEEDDEDDEEPDEDEPDEGGVGGFAGRAREETVVMVTAVERGRGGGVRHPASRTNAPVTHASACCLWV